MPRLTKSVVDAARPREKQFTIWCSDTKGFGVYVHPTGRCAYFVDYYNAGGARKRMTIGQHGQITCEAARKVAMKTIGDVTIKSEDPLAERKSRRNSITSKSSAPTIWRRQRPVSSSGSVAARRSR